MRVDLKGLFANVAAEIRTGNRDFYKFALDEVYQHLVETIGGKHSLTEFADHYCLTERLTEAEAAPTKKEGA